MRACIGGAVGCEDEGNLGGLQHAELGIFQDPGNQASTPRDECEAQRHALEYRVGVVRQEQHEFLSQYLTEYEETQGALAEKLKALDVRSRDFGLA